ncbi:hypothetical protein JW905_16740 [bacterium]|nr:hypothetical protein [candidate division CSSED10-310 bacterium]
MIEALRGSSAAGAPREMYARFRAATGRRWNQARSWRCLLYTLALPGYDS